MSARAWSLVGSAEKGVGFHAQFHPVRKARIPASQFARERRCYSSESTRTQETRRLSAVRPPRRQEGYTNPRSSYNSSPAPAPPLRKPDHSDTETAEWLHNLFQPHLSLSQPLPAEVAARIVTHASWNKGLEGHNSRLIFLGRRVMNAYMNMFLLSRSSDSTPSSQKSRKSKAKLAPAFGELEFNLTAVIERLMDTYTLGEHVGPAWGLERVMRWTPALPMSEAPTSSSPPALALRSSGLYKVRGACVEAAIGGVFHQYGGKIAHRVFHTHVLPHLTREGLGMPRQLIEDVQRLQQAFSRTSSPTQTGSASPSLPHEEPPQQVFTTASNQKLSASLSSRSPSKGEPIKLK